MKNVVVGVIAHVDSGKTTLSEAMLLNGGKIKKLGRVDHRDAYLDTDEQEKARGITIFSKQAQFDYGDLHVTLLDTPGHVDFGPEMERTLQVLDVAVLVINGMEGVQSHTETLWKLLEKYNVPAFVFVNKMDMTQLEKSEIMDDIKKRLSDSCVDFLCPEAGEQIAVCREDMLEKFLDCGVNDTFDVGCAIRDRLLFPCYFGSALKDEGVDVLLDAMSELIVLPERNGVFGARVFKIARDDKGDRLTYMKITGGALHLKDIISMKDKDGEVVSEKVNQIRVYSGNHFDSASEAEAGTVCAVCGLENTYILQGIGDCPDGIAPSLAPVLSYKVLYPSDVDGLTMTAKLTQLMEEEPQLSVKWDEVKGEVYIRVMGPVQLEVIQKLVETRYGIKISYGQGRISYRETIATKSLGVGHFEPLRHYAEVHLLLEPGEPGSGLVFDTIASEDVLAKNWQRLILTHLAEKEHVGVLTGSPITDIKITLTTGKAHPKHTEGGDFRQATYRAVRQGLMMAQSVLLEPVYNFKIEVPHEFAGRVLSDIVRLKGVMQSQEIEEETTIISGKAPVFTMREYYSELTALSRGRGKLWLELSGYEPCHNTDYVLEQVGYEPDMDMSNPSASVFCAHGAGYLVDWYDVHENMHLKEDPAFAIVGEVVVADEDYEKDNQRRRKSSMDMSLSQEELEEIFARTYGGAYKDKEQSRMKYRKTSSSYETNGISSGNAREKAASVPQNYKIASGALKRKNSGQEYLIVDGYNVIFCWDELKKLAEINLDSARDKLMDVLSNYQGYMNMSLTVVFDGYKVKDNPGTKYKYDNISVVYTKEGETADAYIEKLTHELGKKHKVTVVTSDRLEQIVTMGQGAIRMSSRDFEEEVDRVNRHIRDNYLGGGV